MIECSDLGALKAASTVNGTAHLAHAGSAGLFFWMSGDYTSQADDLHIIKADSTALSVGAWVRLGSGSIQHVQNGTGAVRTTVAASVAVLGITPNEFGLAFDGSDETAKLQAMINAGATYKVPIFLHGGGTTYITSTLDCRAKYVDIRGVSGQLTAIAAAASMTSMFNFSETADGGFAPYTISNLKIDGGGHAAVGVLTCYRRGSKISGCSLTGFTEACLRERDTFAVLRENSQFAGSPTSIDLQGANNNTKFTRCTFSGATVAHVNIGNAGSAGTGNFGLYFSVCDIEYGQTGGKGIVAAAFTNSYWSGCYIGESLQDAVIENSGLITLDGGELFFDSTTATTGIVPLGGSVELRRVKINPEGARGITNLISLSDAAVASGTYGRVALRNSPYTGAVGGTPLIKGDVLNYGETRQVFAPRLGRSWAAETSNTTVTDSVVGNARSVTCASVTGGSPKIGLSASMISQDWRIGEPLYLVVVYSATKDLTFQVSSSALGSAIASLGPLPSTTAKVRTAVQLNVAAFATSGTPVVEMFMNGTAAVSDNVTLYEAFIADSRAIDSTVGAFGNLYKC